MIDNSWGWTSYQKAGWAREDGRKLYIGHFKQGDDPFNYTHSRVLFWAHRPVLALRAIVNSGKDPIEFHERDVN